MSHIDTFAADEGLPSILGAAHADQVSKVFEVSRKDGASGYYRFLSVHPNPARAQSVGNRFATLNQDLPLNYQIPPGKIPYVRDQGQRGTCAFFATVGILEAYYLRHPPLSRLKLSEECLTDARNWMFDQSYNYTGEDAPAQRPDRAPNQWRGLTSTSWPALIRGASTYATWRPLQLTRSRVSETTKS